MHLGTASSSPQKNLCLGSAYSRMLEQSHKACDSRERWLCSCKHYDWRQYWKVFVCFVLACSRFIPCCFSNAYAHQGHAVLSFQSSWLCLVKQLLQCCNCLRPHAYAGKSLSAGTSHPILPDNGLLFGLMLKIHRSTKNRFRGELCNLFCKSPLVAADVVGDLSKIFQLNLHIVNHKL